MSLRRVLALGVLFLLALKCFPTPHSDRSESLFPPSLQSLSRELPLTDEERQLYKNCQIEKRAFQLRKETVVVMLVDATANPHAVHPPELCLKSSGWEVCQQDFRLPQGSARQIVAEKGAKREDTLMWFSHRDHQYSGMFQNRLRLALYRLSLGRFGDPPLAVLLCGNSSEGVDWPHFLVAFPELANL